MEVHKITPVDGDLRDLLYKTFTKHCSGYVNVDGCILPQHYEKFADAIENFEVRDDDIWVCGFTKTGTTWAQEMVWCIVNDLDFERGSVPIAERFPLLDVSFLFEKAARMYKNQTGCGADSADFVLDSVNYARKVPIPRFLKTHLPIDLLPRQLRSQEKKPKIIYMCRNPKDTCVSYYHFCLLLMGFQGSFEEFCTLFLGDTIYYGPYWKNVLGFWNKRNDYNMLFLKYEDMIEDLPSAIRKTAAFLGKNLTNDQVSLLLKHLSFSHMKNNPAVNQEAAVKLVKKLLQDDHEGVFMRSGTTGQWKDVMSPEMIKRFDDWTLENLKGTGLSLVSDVVLDVNANSNTPIIVNRQV